MHYFIPFAIPKCCSVAALQCCSVAVCFPEYDSLTRRYIATPHFDLQVEESEQARGGSFLGLVFKHLPTHTDFVDCLS